MGNFSMPRYFQNMPVVGKAARANAENVAELLAIEENIHAEIVKGLENGTPDEKLNEKCYILPGLGDAGDRLFGTK